MSNQFLILPFSNGVDASPGGEPIAEGDEIELLDDVDNLDADEPSDAAWDDDAGPVEAPTRAALLRARAREAATLARGEHAEKARLSPDEAEEGAGLKADVEARLAARDARGEANKDLDRLERRVALAIATGLGPWAKPRPRKSRDAQRPTWAAFALDAVQEDRPCDCKARRERRSKEELIREIARLRASSIPTEMLWSNFTRAGLIALLCGHLCGSKSKRGGGDEEGDSKAIHKHRMKRLSRKH